MKSSEMPSPIWTFAPRPCIEQPACSAIELGQRLRAQAAELGLVAVGFAPATAFDDARTALNRWIADGYHGTMQYLASGADRGDPRCLLAQASTLVVVAVPYQQCSRDVRRLPLCGQIAGYAQGIDYHQSVRGSLSVLGQLIANHSGQTVTARACVDTAPLLEREAARQAGLGFIGKSNMLIVPGAGSRVVLGALLVDVEIASGSPLEHRCGRCSACLDACPTQAFVSPWLLDARRCISYLTIEYKGWIPHELRPLMGTRVFGCDVCQDVCPFNHGKDAIRGADLVDAAAPLPSVQSLDMWLRLTSSDYRRLTKGSALRRASRAQLLRNAAVAAGNSHDLRLVKPLRDLLEGSTYPIVRGHAAWALGQLGAAEALESLRAARFTEVHELVLREIELASLRNSSGRADVGE